MDVEVCSGAHARRRRLMSHELVAHAGCRDDPAGCVRTVFELVAKLLHVDAQILDLVYVLLAPNLAKELRVREHASGIRRQEMQQLEFRWGEAHLAAADEDAPLDDVDLEVTHRHSLAPRR